MNIGDAARLLIAVCAMTVSSPSQTSGYVSWVQGEVEAISGAPTTPQVPAEQKPETNPQPKPEPKPGKKMGTPGLKGTISQDGTIFVNDEDGKRWRINNPDAVKGHEGHHVILKGYVSAETNVVDVKSVKLASEPSKSNDKMQK